MTTDLHGTKFLSPDASNRADGHNLDAITAHRDPPLCGVVIATVSPFGEAPFRVWSGPGVVEWKTTDGDLVLLAGNGAPRE